MAVQDPPTSKDDEERRFDPTLKANPARGEKSGGGFQGSSLKANGARGDSSGRAGGLATPDLGQAETEASNPAQSGGKDPLTPEQIKESEDSPDHHEPSWYQRAAVGAAKTGLGASTSKFKKAILATVVVNLIAVLLLLMLATLGPLKHIHFETILRSVNFARFQLIIRHYSSKVVFESAVLRPDSQGSFRKSPLVRQILLATPDRQIKQLGRSGKIKWDFYENRGFGSGALPLGESLKGVVIDTGTANEQRFYIDDYSQAQYGKNYRELSRGQKWRIESRFVGDIKAKLGNLMSLMPRHVRFNPMYQLRQRTGMRLYAWLDSARSYRNMSSQESRAQLVDETADKVFGVEESLPHSSSNDIQEAAEERRSRWIEALKRGGAVGPAGEVASALGTRMKTLGNVSDAVFVLTTTCIVHDLANSFTAYQDEREAMAVRSAGNETSTTDQIKSGHTVGEADGAASSFWNSFGTVPDASSSYIYRKVTGQRAPPDKEVQRQTEAMPWLKPVSIFAQGITATDQVLGNSSILGLLAPSLNKKILDEACNKMLDPTFQAITTFAELAVTLVSLGSLKGATAVMKAGLNLALHAAVGITAGALLNSLINKAIAEYSALAFSGLLQGADRFNADYVAFDSLSQTPNRMTYGRPVSQEEADTAQVVAMEELQAENRDKPFNERYFAIDNPYSLTGMMVARMPAGAGDMASTVRNAAAFLGSILSTPFRLIGSLSNGGLFSSKAHAAESTLVGSSFGVEEWGWSTQEMQRIDTDDSFALEPLVNRVEPRLDELNERYGKCYNFTTFVLQSEKPEEGCSQADLSTDDALYWRYYNALMFSATFMSGDV